MSCICRVPKRVFNKMKLDLKRAHPFAFERVGFLFFKKNKSSHDEYTILATEYMLVADEHYINDPMVGAKINNMAIRAVFQHLLDTSLGVLHVHLHDHYGKPQMSKSDSRGIPPLVKSFHNLGLDTPHGMLIFSKDNMNGWISSPKTLQVKNIVQTNIVGFPTRLLGISL